MNDILGIARPKFDDGKIGGYPVRFFLPYRSL